MSLSEREEITFSIPRTLTSTVTRVCRDRNTTVCAQGVARICPGACLDHCLPAQGLGALWGEGGKASTEQEEPLSCHLIPSCASGHLPKSYPTAQHVWECSIHRKLYIPKTRGSSKRWSKTLLPYLLLCLPCLFSPSQDGKQHRGCRGPGSPRTGTW